jgi:hypothetical protein
VPGSFNSNVCVTRKSGALGLAFLRDTHDIPLCSVQIKKEKIYYMMNYDNLLVLLRLEENDELFAGVKIYCHIEDENIVNVVEALLVRSLEDENLMQETGFKFKLLFEIEESLEDHETIREILRKIKSGKLKSSLVKLDYENAKDYIVKTGVVKTEGFNYKFITYWQSVYEGMPKPLLREEKSKKNQKPLSFEEITGDFSDLYFGEAEGFLDADSYIYVINSFIVISKGQINFGSIAGNTQDDWITINLESIDKQWEMKMRIGGGWFAKDFLTQFNNIVKEMGYVDCGFYIVEPDPEDADESIHIVFAHKDNYQLLVENGFADPEMME